MSRRKVTESVRVCKCCQKELPIKDFMHNKTYTRTCKPCVSRNTYKKYGYRKKPEFIMSLPTEEKKHQAIEGEIKGLEMAKLKKRIPSKDLGKHARAILNELGSITEISGHSRELDSLKNRAYAIIGLGDEEAVEQLKNN